MRKSSGKIVLVVQAFPVVSETFIANKFRALNEVGLNVHLFCNRTDAASWSKFPELRDDRARRRRVHVSWPHRPILLAIVLLPVALLRSILFQPLATLRYLKLGSKQFGLDIFRRFYLDSGLILLNPDVIHFEFGAIAAGRMYLGELLNCKVAVSFRGYDLNFVGFQQRNFYRDVWEKADILHLLGDDLWESAKRRGCPEHKPKVLIPPAVNLSYFQCKREVAVNVGTPDRPFRILSVGRLEWKKGYEYALQAVKQLMEKGVTCEYRIVGHGNYLEPLIFARHQLGVDREVHFLGVRAQKEVRNEMVWADVLLHSAISEGFCNAVVEAQSMNLPVVCSDAGGLRENVADDSTGFVVPRRSADRMAEKLELLARDPDLRARVGQSGRARAVTRYGAEDQIARFVAMYRRLFSDQRSGGEAPERSWSQVGPEY